MNPVVPAPPHQPLTALIEERKHLIEEIYQGVNKQSPSEIETATTREKIERITAINRTINQRIQESGKRKKCCNLLTRKGVKISTWIVLAISSAAWLATTILMIEDYATGTPMTRTGKRLAELVVAIVVIFATTIVGTGVKLIDDDVDKLQLLTAISRVENQGEEQFLRFLKALEEYKKSQGDGEKLTQCIHVLDKMPEKGLKERIPSRDHWVSLMLEILPENHPIKQQFTELKQAAMRIFNFEEHSSDGKEEDSPQMPLSDPSLKEPFSGEKEAVSRIIANRMRGSDDSKEEEEEEVDAFMDQHNPIAQYQSEWQVLEGMLGTKMGCVPFKDKWINKEAQVIDLPDQPLPRRGAFAQMEVYSSGDDSIV